eukprot:scaffold418060_cov48-Prasinocladus_malaysianus.AAC.1
MKLTNEQIPHLAVLTQLKTLLLTGGHLLSEPGISSLHALTRLENLSLSHCYCLTPEAMESLG